jgi:hypothetical protein
MRFINGLALVLGGVVGFYLVGNGFKGYSRTTTGQSSDNASTSPAAYVPELVSTPPAIGDIFDIPQGGWFDGFGDALDLDIIGNANEAIQSGSVSQSEAWMAYGLDSQFTGTWAQWVAMMNEDYGIDFSSFSPPPANYSANNNTGFGV